MKILVGIILFCITLFAVEPTAMQLQMLKDAGYAKTSSNNVKKVVINKQVVENNIEENKTDEDKTDEDKTENRKNKSNEILIQRYGSNFFNNKNKLNPYSIPTPSNYKLNYNDKLSLTIYGSNTENFELFVNKNGKIQIPKVGEFKVIGSSFKDVKIAILEKTKKAYPNSTSILVDILEFTSIQVTVSGLVDSPGLYNLASFSSIKDALIVSGGILKNGSFRNIVLKRAGKIYKTFDLYKLIRYGDASSDLLLNNGDVIVVNPSIKVIELTGAVNMSAVYELKHYEKFSNLFKYAAGLKANANKNAITLKRYENNTIKAYTLTLKELYKIKPKNGDIVNIDATSNIGGNLITINGNVVSEGDKGMPDDKKLSTLLKNQLKIFGKNGYFKRNTNFDYATISNINSFTSFSIQDVLDSKTDKMLKNGDKITILKYDDLQVKPYFYANGSIVNDKKRKYTYSDGITVSDLFDIVLFNTEIIIDGKRKAVVADKRMIQITRIVNNIKKTILVNIKEQPSFAILKFDEIKFFEYSSVNDSINATIRGEVFITGTYNITNNTTINSLIKLAGGFTKKVQMTRCEIVRFGIKDNSRVRTVMSLNLKEIIDNNFKILADDEITIFPIANWLDKEYITIEGRVKFPGKYAISEGEKLSSVIERAGGYLGNAFLEGTIFTRESIQKLQEKRMNETLDRLQSQAAKESASVDEAGEDKAGMLDGINNLIKQAKQNKPIGRISLSLYHDLERFKTSKYNIALQNNDKIFIPTMNDTVSIVGEVLNQATLVYDDNLDVDEYILKAGGITELANSSHIYVIKANGEALKYQKSFFFSDKDKVFKGDTIVVPIKIDTTSGIKYAKDISSIVYQLAITAASLKTLGAI
jgi:protein involved in polysaccharide export with SLBB domain